MSRVKVGTKLASQCGHLFGDVYGDKRVEALGPDWVIARGIQDGVVACALVAPERLEFYIGQKLWPDSDRLYTDSDINELSLNGCFDR